MKVKIINNKSEDYGNTFKVRRMNYNQIIVNYPVGTGLKKFLCDEVECIRENEIDDFLINNREFLKIKLKRGISVTFYSALYEALKLEIDEDIKVLNVLRDKYSVNKRGIWQKEILLTVNNKFPIEIVSSGQNFKTSGYDININKVEKDIFLEMCYLEIDNINREIQVKNSMIASFNDAIQEIKSTKEIQ